MLVSISSVGNSGMRKIAVCRLQLKSNKINQKIMKLTKNMAILRTETYEKNNQDIERNNTTLPVKIKSNEEEVMETHSEGNVLRT